MNALWIKIGRFLSFDDLVRLSGVNRHLRNTLHDAKSHRISELIRFLLSFRDATIRRTQVRRLLRVMRDFTDLGDKLVLRKLDKSTPFPQRFACAPQEELQRQRLAIDFVLRRHATVKQLREWSVWMFLSPSDDWAWHVQTLQLDDLQRCATCERMVAVPAFHTQYICSNCHGEWERLRCAQP